MFAPFLYAKPFCLDGFQNEQAEDSRRGGYGQFIPVQLAKMEQRLRRRPGQGRGEERRDTGDQNPQRAVGAHERPYQGSRTFRVDFGVFG